MIAYTPTNRVTPGTAHEAAERYIEVWTRTKSIDELKPSRAAAQMIASGVYKGKRTGLESALQRIKFERTKNEREQQHTSDTD